MPSQVVEKTNSSKIDDKDLLSEAIESVFRSEKSAVSDAKLNSKAANFLLGKLMQSTKGRADPKVALDLIKKKLIEPD
jgi:aspartyl-tRNA(Asn)/glutamyl-tRNA(Gln) amidotransferase subunit B